MQQAQYSIVVPVYNSEGSLQPLFERIDSFFNTIGKKYQLVLVDDGSKDRSWPVMLQLKQKHYEKIRLVRLAKNSGQHNATLCGIHHSVGQFIITIDDDLQIPPEEIGKLIQRYEETQADLVYGTFPNKQHSIFRNVGSWVFNKVFRYIGSTSGNGSSFRMITRQLADNMKMLNQKYLLLDEVLCWYTSSVAYTPVDHQQRTIGRSGYSTFKLIFLSFNYIINYTNIPLRLMTYMGLFFSIITFSLSIYYVYDKLVRQVELGFTSLIVAIFFSTSLILFCLGIIGEYISRLYSRDGSPHYIIKEVR